MGLDEGARKSDGEKENRDGETMLPSSSVERDHEQNWIAKWKGDGETMREM